MVVIHSGSRLFQFLPLSFFIFFISTILSPVNASAAPPDGGGGGSSSSNGGNSASNDLLLAELRVSAYLATMPLCMYCSEIIKNFTKPITSINAEGEMISNIIRDHLLAIKERKYNGEDIPEDLYEAECSNLVREQLAWALRAESTKKDPSRSFFLPQASTNPRNNLLYTVAAEIETDEENYNCSPEFPATEDDELKVL